MTWQPIETAPKDQRVLLYGQMRTCELLQTDGPEVFSGYWDDIDGAWCGSGSTYHDPFYTPTHWMPLPEPPPLIASHQQAVTVANEYRYLRREFYWLWPRDGMAWFFWAHQNYSSNWIAWRIGPLNYQVEVAQPGECSYRVVSRPVTSQQSAPHQKRDAA